MGPAARTVAPRPTITPSRTTSAPTDGFWSRRSETRKPSAMPQHHAAIEIGIGMRGGLLGPTAAVAAVILLRLPAPALCRSSPASRHSTRQSGSRNPRGLTDSSVNRREPHIATWSSVFKPSITISPMTPLSSSDSPWLSSCRTMPFDHAFDPLRVHRRLRKGFRRTSPACHGRRVRAFRIS